MDERIIWTMAILVIVLLVLALGMGIFKNIQGIVNGI